jgi:hypothetical protein
VDRACYGVVQYGARLDENGFGVFKRLPRLLRDPTLDQLPRLSIDTLLTRNENKVCLPEYLANTTGGAATMTVPEATRSREYVAAEGGAMRHSTSIASSSAV